MPTTDTKTFPAKCQKGARLHPLNKYAARLFSIIDGPHTYFRLYLQPIRQTNPDMVIFKIAIPKRAGAKIIVSLLLASTRNWAHHPHNTVVQKKLSVRQRIQYKAETSFSTLLVQRGTIDSVQVKSCRREENELMARKKENEITVSAEEQAQIQDLLTHYQLLAKTLHTSKTPNEAQAALVALNTLSETAQFIIVKALAKELTTDAADVLAAINAFSSRKEIRKEARRSLLRIEASKVVPQWTAPIEAASAVRIAISNTPRFWKGVITQTREEGEIQLLLSWEQGYDYSEARILIFLLDFWKDGIKDILVDSGGKRRVDEHINDMRTKITNAHTIDCTLAEGKRMLEEALSVNEWRGTTPAQEYRNRLPLLNQLIWQVAELGDDRGYTFIHPELAEQEVIINFIGSWTLGDYGLTYDLLTRDSSIREGLERDEWIERRRAWFREAKPARLELGFVHEREQRQSALWLPPSSINPRAAVRKEIEIGWSVELSDTLLNGTLREMPMGTAINKDTGRHWFWTNYTVVREAQGWRIQNITDEGANVQGLSIDELQKRIKEYEEVIETRVKQRDLNPDVIMEELSWRLTQLLHYYDALLIRLPLDINVNEKAYTRALTTGNPERTVVYLERMANRFGEHKGDTLRRLGATLTTLAYNYTAPEMRKRQDALLAHAENTLREAIAIDDSAIGHILLAEFLLSQGRNDDTEQELLKAKMMDTTPNEEASIEAGLGNLAMRQERVQAALPHFERVADINPNYPGVWFSLGFTQRLLGRIDAAEESYRRAIHNEPNDIRPYAEMIAIYMNRDEQVQARLMGMQGIQANPESAHLRALYASVLYETGEARNAQRELERAEELDPQDEMVVTVRQYISDKSKKK